jgi:hypothetical protein
MSYLPDFRRIFSIKTGGRRRSPQGSRAPDRALAKNAFPATKASVSKDGTQGRLPQLRVLRLGFVKGGDVGIGSFPRASCTRASSRRLGLKTAQPMYPETQGSHDQGVHGGRSRALGRAIGENRLLAGVCCGQQLVKSPVIVQPS